MDDKNTPSQASLIYDLLDLRKDSEQPHKIDQSIRSGVRVVGTNLWVLVFAILIASVGLNVNSTAVIIGAMLISPLMGPIIGIGYGAGINDFSLIKLSFRNLGIFTALSIVSSTLYFTLSPLNIVTPELLARTSPNLWDVLIAFFGGSAGIIALTRKSISNVVPGVAIATALMPPLCTAGFGISQGNWDYFAGAFFLYCINSVFIACATWMFVKILRLPTHTDLDKTTATRTNVIIFLTIFLMIVPSSYLAYNLVQRNSFDSEIESVISASYDDADYVILSHETNYNKKEVTLTVGGENPPKDLAGHFAHKFNSRGLAEVAVIVRYSGSGQVDMGSLKNELRQDLFNSMQKQVESLSEENKNLKSRIDIVNSYNDKKQALFSEIRAQYPQVGSISISTGYIDQIVEQVVTSPEDRELNGTEQANTEQTNSAQQADTTVIEQKSELQETERKVENRNMTLVTIDGKESLTAEDKQRLKNWLDVRFTDKQLKIIYLDELAAVTSN